MFQITSGKFFDPAKGFHESPSEVVLYSNLGIYIPLESSVGTLTRLHHDQPYFQYSFRYQHRIEKDEGKAGMVKASEGPVLEHLCSLLTVFLKAYFSGRLESVESHCSPSKANKLVSGYLDSPRLVDMPQQEACREFIKKTVDLPRKDYLAVVGCCVAVRDALEALHTNSDLAYSLLVFAAESLAQRADDYTPQWDHHPRHDSLQPILNQLEASKAEAIKSELVAEANFKSLQRFISFLELHLESSYFLEEAVTIKQPLRKSELRAALAKVYNLRSKYAHELQEIQHQLKVPQIAEGDVFRWLNEPFLTFNGLLRLITHALVNFVKHRPKVETEQINWKGQLPGIVTLLWSPEYIIFRENNVAATNARQRLEGFLSLLTVLESSGENKIADLRPVLSKYFDLFSQANEENKRAICCLADLWTTYFKAYPLPDPALKMWETNKGILDACTQETMILAVVHGKQLWKAEEMAKVYQQYEKGRVKRDRACYPQHFDFLVMLHIALTFKSEGNLDEYKLWLQKALLDVPGLPSLQHAVGTLLNGADDVNLYQLVFPPRLTTQET